MSTRAAAQDAAGGGDAPRPCPMCAAAGTQLMFTGRDTVYDTPGLWGVVRCVGCGQMFTDPAVPPAEMPLHYPSSYSAHAAAGADRRRRRRDPWDRMPPIGHRRLLDIGCGSGGYLARMAARGWRVTGVEPSSAAAGAARSAGLNVVTGVFPGAALPEAEYDAVVMLGVIGCLPDPMATLRAARAVMAAGGRLIVSEHNAASSAAERFGPYWQGWDLPRHYNHFTPATLRAMLERTGFVNVRISGRRRSSRWRHSARAMLRERPAGGLMALAARSRLAASWLSAVHGRGERADEIIAEADR